MGVPAFYRWLSEKYPKIVQDVLEDRVHLAPNSSSIRLPFDSTRPNPSGVETDNLYIDMNGIIHPCSHPENGPQPQSEVEMYQNVCHYVDRLFRAFRPRKLLYLAIDGVAPRAKMNQQRSRRFRSAQEVREANALEAEIKDSLIKAGHELPPEGKNQWDSNVITPGTTFMLGLSDYLRFYIRKRISTDKAWKACTVIFSDASIPGEGEHKIMSHIRLQRTQPNYNPNLVHTLHGLDADLIMLALATHEAHFYISREEVVFGRKGAEQSELRKMESGFADQQKQLDEHAGHEAMELLENKTKPFQRVSIPILREYLANEFKVCERVPFKGEVSFERVIDDIVFLCFFVGNDFLPHLPSLDIRDGAMDYLFNVYKRILPSLGDYITSHGGEVNLSHVDVILAEVGSIEDYIFSMKYENEQNDKRRRKEFDERKKNLTKGGEAPKADYIMGKQIANTPNVASAPPPKGSKAARLLALQEKTRQGTNINDVMVPLGREQAIERKSEKAAQKSRKENEEAAKELQAQLTGEKRKADSQDVTVENDDDDEEEEEEEEKPVEKKLKPDEALELLKKLKKEAEQKQRDKFAEEVEDKVRLHEKGWKDRYYSDKCKADDVAQYGGKEHLFKNYIMGLCWVMKYYYEGCPSWKWYYPFHYAPFASDLKNIERFADDCSKFELGRPFKPVEQLMGVLPEDSSHAIPKESRWLMSDPESPIIDFYPKDVLCDPNGKAMPWLWVVLLPFIDEQRLLDALGPSQKKWTEKEKLGNAKGLGDGYVYCHITHPLVSAFTQVLDSKNKVRIEKAYTGDYRLNGTAKMPLSNEIYPLDKVTKIPSPAIGEAHFERLDEVLADPIETNAAICVTFKEPKKELHKSVLLEGAKLLDPILDDNDKRIRRPRLNRGGGTIANMGGGRNPNGQSSQNGYGSMNINTFERGLAERNGRGRQMHQTGTRAWGAMEPSQYDNKHRNNNYNNNRSGHHNQSGGQHQQHQQQYQQNQFQPFQQNGVNNRGGRGGGRGRGRGGRTNNFHGNQQHQFTNPQNRWQAPPPPPPHARGRGNFHPNRNQQNSHSFRPSQQSSHFAHPGIPTIGAAPVRRPGPPPQNNVNPNVMKDLRSQLASTLQRNKKDGKK